MVTTAAPSSPSVQSLATDLADYCPPSSAPAATAAAGHRQLPTPQKELAAIDTYCLGVCITELATAQPPDREARQEQIAAVPYPALVAIVKRCCADSAAARPAPDTLLLDLLDLRALPESERTKGGKKKEKKEGKKEEGKKKKEKKKKEKKKKEKRGRKKEEGKRRKKRN